MQLLSVFQIQLLLFLDSYDKDAMALKKLSKLNFRYFTISYQMGYQGLF